MEKVVLVAVNQTGSRESKSGVGYKKHTSVRF